jgi:hypothetical protein
VTARRFTDEQLIAALEGADSVKSAALALGNDRHNTGAIYGRASRSPAVAAALAAASERGRQKTKAITEAHHARVRGAA